MIRLLLTAALAVTPTAAAADPFARARSDITTFCKNEAKCIAAQRKQLGHFVTMMGGFNDPGNRTARACMTKGKRGKFVDWTVAADCMRQATKGKPLGGTISPP